MTEAERLVIEARKRERFEAMAVRLANHLEMSAAAKFVDLPVKVRDHFNGMRYYDIIKPLIQEDFYVGRLSYRQLCIRYGVAKSTIQSYLKK